MFSRAKSLDAQSQAAVAEFLAKGGQVQVVPAGKARSRNAGGWDRLNDQSRSLLGRAVG